MGGVVDRVRLAPRVKLFAMGAHTGRDGREEGMAALGNASG